MTNAYEAAEITQADAYESEYEWEPQAEFTASLMLSDLIGTHMHVEVERDAQGEIVSEPMSADELRKLATRDTFDWLAS